MTARTVATIRERSAQGADSLILLLVVALPWSTSAVGVLAVLWLLAMLPALDRPSLRHVLSMSAGGLPVLLCALAVLGMLWAGDAPLKERWDGLASFLKLLAIPMLMIQFAKSDRGRWIMAGFIASCTGVMAISWALLLVPGLQAAWPVRATTGIPVHDYIAQSGEFTICIFALALVALEAWRAQKRGRAAACLVLAALFLANNCVVPSSRTTLVVFPILLVLFAFTQMSRRAAAVFLLASVAGCLLVWFAAPAVRQNVNDLEFEVLRHDPNQAYTRAGARIELWRTSVGLVTSAPLIGHGTGSIRAQFRHASGAATTSASNPHNQTFAVAIQLGLLGTAVLLAMWLSHLALFRGEGAAAWAGLVIVTQNIIGSLFNSHLFDFTQGWTYVIGVGVAGGVVLRSAVQRS